MVGAEPRVTLWFGVLTLAAWFAVVGAVFSEVMVAVAFGAMFSVLVACTLAVVVVALRRPSFGRLGQPNREP